MKFEKISTEAYKAYLEENRNAVTSNSQIALLVKYFEEKMPVPVRSTGASAGYDFVAPITVLVPAHGSAKVPTGIKVKLDKDKFLAMYIRSGYATKRGLELMNQVSVIDSDYYGNPSNEGHIVEFIKNNSGKPVIIEQGSRFCQGVIQQYFVVEGDEAGVGKSRNGGFGSTGDKVEVKEVEKETSHPSTAEGKEPELDKHEEDIIDTAEQRTSGVDASGNNAKEELEETVRDKVEPPVKEAEAHGETLDPEIPEAQQGKKHEGKKNLKKKMRH